VVWVFGGLDLRGECLLMCLHDCDSGPTSLQKLAVILLR
jgi:hypothetical protein